MKRTLASALYTYTLAKNSSTITPTLYVPLTSVCNTRTLPQTRGANFRLPPHVVACLLRVRDWESQTQTWKHWCQYLDTVPEAPPQTLPPPPPLLLDPSVVVAGTVPKQATTCPSLLRVLQEEINVWIAANNNRQDQTKKLSLVLNGEGEPTLKWNDLLTLAESYSETCTIRVTTNGLVVSSYNKVSQLKESGVDCVSVALMTWSSHQYNQLMQPVCVPNDSTSSSRKQDAHFIVCDFIQQAVQCGLQVQVTGVDRPDVDKQATQELARKLLGASSSEIQWRPYFGEDSM